MRAVWYHAEGYSWARFISLRLAVSADRHTSRMRPAAGLSVHRHLLPDNLQTHESVLRSMSTRSPQHHRPSRARSPLDLSHSRIQPPAPLLPLPPYQPGYLPGFASHASPTMVLSSARGALPAVLVAIPGDGRVTAIGPLSVHHDVIHNPATIFHFELD